MHFAGVLVTAALAGVAPRALPEIRYTVKVVTQSWEPMPIGVVEGLMEAKAVSALTRDGNLRLTKSNFADLRSGDFVLNIDGRFVEEAEKLSVYLSFGPGRRSELPSFHVAETEFIGGLDRAVMQGRIEAMSARAGDRLRALLAPQLGAGDSRLSPSWLEEPELPWVWGAVEVPKIDSPSELLRRLLEVRNEDHVRFGALAEIERHVFDQKEARHAVEICVLRDPSPALRAACSSALAPVARTTVPTQRILLHALRTECDEKAIEALAELSASFVGLSRKESIESWLEIVAGDAAPPAAARTAAELLSKEGVVPNLDIALAKCLRQEALVYGKKQACAQYLLPVVPKERRLPVVWRYLEEVRVFEQGEKNTFDDVIEQVAGRGSEPLDAALAELLLGVARRPSAGWVRDEAVFLVGRHPAPTARTMELVLGLVPDPETAISALRATRDLVDRSPGLGPPTRAALEKLRPQVRYLVPPSRQDPLEALDATLEHLARRAAATR